MKRILGLTLALVFLAILALGGCAPRADQSPDTYTDIRWVTPDYSFRFNPEDDCKGNYTFNGAKFDVKVKFDGAHVTVTDTAADKELFSGEWMYEDGNHLYIHSLHYNTDDYEELKKNYSGFYRLHQEALKKADEETTEKSN